MFKFAHTTYLYLLLIIPFFIAGYIFYLYRLKQSINRYGDSVLLKKLMQERSLGMQHTKFALLMGALIFLIFALANPQTGSSLEKGKVQGVDIMLCMDISNSMLAEDISPNRLEASKMAINHFIDKLKGDRVGLVAFAGKPFVQLPITNDYAVAKMFVNQLNTNLIASQGTDLTSALSMAMTAIVPPQKELSTEEIPNTEIKSKVILLISDGEDHFPEAVDMAKEIANYGITIHTIGIGSTQGVTIPMGRNSFKKDNEGNTVVTRLNEAILRDIAKAGGGNYVHASNANLGLDEIYKSINEMEKSELQEITFTKYESKFQYPLILSLICLILEAFLLSTRPKWRNKLQSIRKLLVPENSIKTLIIGLFFIPCLVHAQTAEEISAMRDGDTYFRKAEKIYQEATHLIQKTEDSNNVVATNKYKEAYKLYHKAQQAYENATLNTKYYSYSSAYNIATALMRKTQISPPKDSTTYKKIEEIYNGVTSDKTAPQTLRASAFHNSGNNFMQQKKFKEAINAYKNALKLNPTDMDTKYNLEYAKKMLAQQQSQGGGGNQNQENKDNNKQEQQNQDKQQGDNKQQEKQQDDKEQNQNKQEQQQQEQNKQQQEQQQAREAAAQRAQKGQDDKQLDALQQNERQLQRRMNEKQAGKPQQKSKQEKDW